MNKNGFTLIELLAVIVILAIISLIAVPVVINIINDTKTSSGEEAVKLYIDSVKKAISRKQLEDTSFNPTECTIQDNGNLLCNDIKVTVDMKGIKPNKGIIEIKDNQVTYKNLLLNGTYYNRLVTPIQDNNKNGKPDIGDKYTYKVNDKDTFNFYVLSENDDDIVNLIMDRNICNDGTVEYKNSNNYCRYKWNNTGYDTTSGPSVIMVELYEGTKEWDNVPDMIMNHEDNNSTSIITNDKITTIIGNPSTKITILGNKEKPLKSRLPKYNEIIEVDCTTSEGTCPVWLLGYMQYWSGADNKYILNKNTNMGEIWGYWMLNSRGSEEVWRVAHSGNIGGNSPTFGRYGARPVITVPRDYLE